MKKSQLIKVIKEEIQNTLKENHMGVEEDLTEAVMLVAENEGDLYRAYTSGEMTAEEVVKKAARMYLKAEMDDLRDRVFFRPQMRDMVRVYKRRQAPEETGSIEDLAGPIVGEKY